MIVNTFRTVEENESFRYFLLTVSASYLLHLREYYSAQLGEDSAHVAEVDAQVAQLEEIPSVYG